MLENLSVNELKDCATKSRNNEAESVATPPERDIFAPQSYSAIKLLPKKTAIKQCAPSAQKTSTGQMISKDGRAEDKITSESVIKADILFNKDYPLTSMIKTSEMSSKVQQNSPGRSGEEEAADIFAPCSYSSIVLVQNCRNGQYKEPNIPRDDENISTVIKPITEQALEMKLTESSIRLQNSSSMRKESKQQLRLYIQKKQKVNAKYVSNPRRILGGETPQRPFPKELYEYNKEVCGSATEIFDMIFPTSSKTADFCPWTDGNFAAPSIHFQELEKRRQDKLRSYTGVTKEERKRRKHLEILLSVQNIMWLVHSQKKENFLVKTCRLMVQKFSCRTDSDNRLRLISKDELSLVWNENLGIENSSILSQRKPDWSVRPVFIDGLSLFDMLSQCASTLPIIHTGALLEILLHFILDGHSTVIYLPEVYRSNTSAYVDDSQVFEFLCSLDVLKFVDKRNRKAVEEEVLNIAEQTYGIVVSASENLSECTLFSIQCFPVFNKYSTRVGKFVFSSFFESTKALNKRLNQTFTRKSDKPPTIYKEVAEKVSVNLSRVESDENEPSDKNTCMNLSESIHEHLNPRVEARCFATTVDSGVVVDQIDETISESDNTSFDSDISDVDTVEAVQSYQYFSRKCRLYTDSEKLKIDTFQYQLTLKRQVTLVSSFIHLTTFHFQRHRQIQTFLTIVNRFVPEHLPYYGQMPFLDSISAAIQDLKTGNNSYKWPILTQES